MSPAPPRRLRDLKQQPLPAPPRRRRSVYIAAIALLGVMVVALAYGFLQHSIFRPRVDATIEQTDMYVKAGEHIQVNIINACGAPGMAQKFTEFLRARKFDVPEFGTAPARESYSRVIDRVGDPVSARKVAYALGIPPERIDVEIDSSLYLRATVIIGEDYRTLRPMK